MYTNSFNITTVRSSNSAWENLSYCALNQPTNPYCGVFEAKEIVEVVFLFIATLVGTSGNLLVIFSIIYDKRVHRHGNVFIINLAVADLIVRFPFFFLINF